MFTRCVTRHQVPIVPISLILALPVYLFIPSNSPYGPTTRNADELVTAPVVLLSVDGA